MYKEISSGGILFRRKSSVIQYLLLKHEVSRHKSKSEYWNFPKGHVEKGESEVQAALREIREETGIRKLNFISGFRLSETYFYWKKDGKRRVGSIFKTVIWRIAEVPFGAKIKISREHEAFGWFTPEEVYKKLVYAGQRKMFRDAGRFLKTTGLNPAAQRIYVFVSKIPMGKVSTYGRTSVAAGQAGKSRWVGWVLNKNTDPEVPCHRVVMENGAVGGYNKGKNRKVMVLRREGIEIKKGKINLDKFGWKIK